MKNKENYPNIPNILGVIIIMLFIYIGIKQEFIKDSYEKCLLENSSDIDKLCQCKEKYSNQTCNF